MTPSSAVERRRAPSSAVERRLALLALLAADHRQARGP
jgi:hypothetical protein